MRNFKYIITEIMTTDELMKLVQDIVSASKCLNETHTYEKNALVNYACIFTHSNDEFEKMVKVTKETGHIVQETPTGPVFIIPSIITDAGNLNMLKIRKPDPKRPERGDADFTVSDYNTFKKTYIGKPGFNIIVRPEMEMIELIDPCYNVIAYYSHPILAKVLNL